MNIGKIKLLLITSVAVTGMGMLAIHSRETKAAKVEATTVKPALNVTVVQPSYRDIPVTIGANGSIAAWQEAIIGAEVSELKLTEVKVEVGDKVRKGQVLAVFSAESVMADVAQSRAVLAEAEANWHDAHLNAERAKQVANTGVLSNQQVDQYLTSEKTADAKRQSAKAQLELQLLRLKYTKVVASDDGLISSRSATIGAVATRGQELFRLILQNRLEWRGEVTATEISQLKPGLEVTLSAANIGSIKGTIRHVSPVLDVQTRNGLVYVDLPGATAKGLKAGMFAKGEFYLGDRTALIVPQDAISLREGFSYVFRLTAQSADTVMVNQIKVELGRHSGDYLEILSGLQPADKLVASGVTFLADGDFVKVIP